MPFRYCNPGGDIGHFEETLYLSVLVKTSLPSVPHFRHHSLLSFVWNCFCLSQNCCNHTHIKKRPGLDPSLLKNLWPISNLPFISKILEKTVASQLHSQQPLRTVSVRLPLRSQYRNHSPKMTNDLLIAVDSGLFTLLIFLDLCAASETICHATLLNRLSSFSIAHIPSAWFHSYPSGRP